MKKLLFNILLALAILSPLGCDNENLQDISPTIDPNLAIKQNLGLNHEQLGEYVYTHIKYYMGSIDPYQMLNEDIRVDVKNKLEAKIQMVEAQDWDYTEVLDHLASTGTYTEKQIEVLKQQHFALRDFLLSAQPSSVEAWDWMLQQEEEIKNMPTLSLEERSELLNIKAIARHALKYKLETYELTNSLNDHAVSTARACGFWDQAFCYLGAVQSYLGLAAAIIAGGPVGIVAAALGAIIGTYKAVTTCGCNTNVCEAFKGVTFPYVCYTPGDNLHFTGWGHGNVQPTSYEWIFSKGNNLLNDFYGTFTPGHLIPHVTVPGSQLTSNNVNLLAIEAEVICSGNPKESVHGWFNLSELGKPIGVLSGDNYFPASQTGLKFYSLNGPVENSSSASYQWTLTFQPWYGGPPATGTLNAGNAPDVSVSWGSNPGPATLTCTASTNCGTTVYTYNIFIYPG